MSVVHCGRDELNTQLSVRGTGDGIALRVDFCCRHHCPIPYAEVEMTPEGAEKLAADISKAARTMSIEAPQ